VDDPHGDAQCDTSGYAPCIVQLWAVHQDGGGAPLAPYTALEAAAATSGKTPLRTLVLPDQGGWPRSFHFEKLTAGSYTILAFLDTPLRGVLQQPPNDRQPLGWYQAAAAGSDDDDSLASPPTVLTVSITGPAPPFARVVLRAPARLPPASVLVRREAESRL
jgi:hypothetical protein